VTARRLAAMAAVTLAASLGGCGGGGDKAASDPIASAPAAAPAAQRTAYERSLVGVLRGAAGAAGLARQVDNNEPAEANARVFDRVRALYERAYLGMQPVKPPAEIGDVHARVVASLKALAGDAGRARDALRARDAAALKAALADLRAEGLRLQALAAQLSARGY
jgi:hypothetical protein